MIRCLPDNYTVSFTNIVFGTTHIGSLIASTVKPQCNKATCLHHGQVSK